MRIFQKKQVTKIEIGLKLVMAKLEIDPGLVSAVMSSSAASTAGSANVLSSLGLSGGTLGKENSESSSEIVEDEG